MANRSSTTTSTSSTLVPARLGLQAMLNTHPSASAIGNAAIISGLSTALTPLDLDFYAVKDKLGIDAPAGVDLTHAKQVLRVLASLGDGTLGIPGLKSAAQIGIEIINAADTADSNEEDCRLVALQVFRLIQSVDGKVKEDHTLDRHIDLLKSDLVEILQCLKIIGARKVPGKAFHAESDRDTIIKCEKLVDHSRQLFMVNLQVDQLQRVSKMDTKMDTMLALLQATKARSDAQVSQSRPLKLSPSQSEANSDEGNEPIDGEGKGHAKEKAATPVTPRHVKASKSSSSQSTGPQNHGNGNVSPTPQNAIPQPPPSPHPLGPSAELGLAFVGAALSQGAFPTINIGGGNIVGSTFSNINNTQQYIDNRNGATTVPFTHNSPQSLNPAYSRDQSRRQRIEDGEP